MGNGSAMKAEIARRRQSGKFDGIGRETPPCLFCESEGRAVPAVYEGRRPEGAGGLVRSSAPSVANAVTWSCEAHASGYRDNGWILSPIGGPRPATVPKTG